MFNREDKLINTPLNIIPLQLRAGELFVLKSSFKPVKASFLISQED